jgi:hypothetical protein
VITPGLKAGDKVVIEITGTVREFGDGLALIEYSVEGDVIAEAPVEVDAEGLRIVSVAAPEWPPRVKDVWRDGDGDDWYGVLIDDDDMADQPYVVLMAGRSSKSHHTTINTDVLAWHGPFSLVHRDPQDGA